MTKTIVALYDHRSEAEAASRELQAAGFDSSAIEILSHSDLSGGGWGNRGTYTGTATGTTTGDASLGAASGMARTDLSTGYVASPNTVPGTGSALEAGLGGTVGVRFQIEADGRVSDCAVEKSSGSKELDDTTCRLIVERFRFRPSLDPNGRPVPATMIQNHIWVMRQLPPDEEDVRRGR